VLVVQLLMDFFYLEAVVVAKVRVLVLSVTQGAQEQVEVPPTLMVLLE